MYRRLAAAITGAVLVPVLATSPAAAEPNSPDARAHTLHVAPQMLAALERDLGLTADQAHTRLAKEATARRIATLLRGKLGEAYAGVWFNPATGRPVVAVTDAAKIGTVRAAGADPKVVRYSQVALDAVKATLDRKAGSAPSEVVGWYVDAISDSVVVQVNKSAGDVETTDQFLADAVAGNPAVRVATVSQSPRLLEDLRGGDPWYFPGFRCSVGFSTVADDGSPYMITAGHCTAKTGAPATGVTRAPLGYIQNSVFGAMGDYGEVAVTSDQWLLQPWVNSYDGGNVTVAGSDEANIGDSICRAGSTTGWHCGVVLSKNNTVVYSQGTVSNLIRTNVCAEPGDSGGSFISGDQAQGMTSGGWGNCRSGGVTYFSPVNQALNDFGLSLVTG